MSEPMNCPKCDADISDSWEPDDYECGITAGWYCDACDLAVAGWEHPREPMEGDVDIFASTRGQPMSESEPQHTRCPAHPDVLPEMGFGLAGGGYGPYSYCPVCSRIIHKTQEP
jgi:hypothetical protein